MSTLFAIANPGRIKAAHPPRRMRTSGHSVYANNNPYGNIDPDGRNPVAVAALIIYAVGALTHSDPANAPGPGDVAVSTSPGEALSVGLPPARAIAPLRMAVDVGKKTYTTYTRQKSDGQVYSGRTSGKGTPEQQVAARTAKPDHQAKTDAGYGPARVDKNTSSPDAARGREQQLIQQNGGAQSQGGTSGNSINGVSPTNPNAQQYQQACTDKLGCG